MRLGFVSLPTRGAADQLLAELARRWAAAGRPCVALVRAAPEALDPARPCEMALELWPGGQIYPISQDLGPGAEGCSLDAGALELAAAAAEAALARAPAGAPLILNKFGKQEAGGHGLRPLIGAALAEGRAVLLSVPPETRAAFDTFAEGLAAELPPEIAALDDFLRA